MVSETRVTTPVWRSLRNTSDRPLVSPSTRLVAALWNTTKRPSVDTEPARLAALWWVCPSLTETRVWVMAIGELPLRALIDTGEVDRNCARYSANVGEPATRKEVLPALRMK